MKEIIQEEMKCLNKNFYFMSGLPRSGSTVISSILNQNPRFYSGPSSPVVATMIGLENHFSNDELFLGYPKPQQAKEIISHRTHKALYTIVTSRSIKIHSIKSHRSLSVMGLN